MDPWNVIKMYVCMYRLRAFENRVLRRDEMTEGWRKLHNGEVHYG
jgi:hypothetical protein